MITKEIEDMKTRLNSDFAEADVRNLVSDKCPNGHLNSKKCMRTLPDLVLTINLQTIFLSTRCTSNKSVGDCLLIQSNSNN